MKNTLGGALFVWRGKHQDYHYKESIASLAQFCDEIAVVAGGPDGTYHDCLLFMSDLPERGIKVTLIELTQEEWDSHQGREKLSVFTNQAIEALTTDWAFVLQADEILTEESYPEIRRAIEFSGAEGILCNRIHFWYDPLHYLIVPFERMPCGTQIVRLAKKQYRAVDDAESSYVDGLVVYWPTIDILHFGFVRDPKKHMTKIRHIQGDVFQIDVDKRCDGMEVFDPSKFFSKEDVALYTKPIPKLIRPWITERYPDLWNQLEELKSKE